MQRRLTFFISLATLVTSLAVGCTSEKTVQGQSPDTQTPPTITLPGAGGDTTQNSRCVGVEPTRTTEDPSPGDEILAPTTPGASKPMWTLRDVQPQSCGHDQVYGLDAFDGQPLMVVLLKGTCGFCHSQAVKLQQMHYELRAEGVDIQFVIVNEDLEGNSYAEQFVERTYFPIFQDAESVDAWGQMKGGKDDFYLYRSDGQLFAYLSFANDDDLTLSSGDGEASGYSFLKRTLYALIENDMSGEPVPTSLGTDGGGGTALNLVNVGGTTTEPTASGSSDTAGGADGAAAMTADQGTVGGAMAGGMDMVTSVGGRASNGGQRVGEGGQPNGT
ncbi:MAG: redoxin family protein [Myxococcota bacterium]|nr:redoxin family protein [Myxococcota bacterium]